MRVIATAVGYDNLAVRNPGEEFDMPDGSHAPWFEPVDPKLKAAYHGGHVTKAQVPAIDPAKQQADQEAEHARLAAEQKKSGRHATEPHGKK